ncbi:hypothetical protein LTR62_008819 [Meristemomyces frigidus]|uniref:Uncharacterized protein n=1 Tax=Meristemomyces frigidus TaxID=1508187 RepID=A0AAN7THR9_9PEZI|nr:hypothetical protein LTR62_008819 [Meristemomyces frigidus]
MSFKFTQAEHDECAREKVALMREGSGDLVSRLVRIAGEKGLNREEEMELWRKVRARYLGLEEARFGQVEGSGKRGPSFGRPMIEKLCDSIKKWSAVHEDEEEGRGGETPRPHRS